MITLLVIHRVEDFDRWHAVFKKHSGLMDKHGGTGVEILRETDDPNNVAVITRWPDKESLMRFRDSHDLKQSKESGGVIGEPMGYFLETVA